jgi:tetratricopeptide (TPR) repeat protein
MSGGRGARALGMLTVLALSGVLAGSAAAQTTRRVLVMPFAAGVDPQVEAASGAALWLGEAAAILLGEGLTSIEITALSRDERVAAFDRLQLPMTSSLTRATMIRVAELIGATDVVFGGVTLGKTLEVRARLIHLESGRELPGVQDSGTLPEIFALFGRVANRLGASLGRTGPAGAAAPPPMPLAAFESYVKGLVAATPPVQQRFLETANAQAPGDARILMDLWSVYSAQGMPDRALAAANAVPAESSLARKARFAVGLSLIELKRLDGAFVELTALAATGAAPAIANALGVVQLRRSAPAGTSPAVTYFTRAAAADPGNPNYLFNLGYAHALAGNAKDALESLREAVRFDAAHGDAHLVMSAVLAGAGRAVEAAREFELAKLLGTRSELGDAAPPTRVPEGLEWLGSDLDVSPRHWRSAFVANPAQHDQQATAAFHLGQARRLIEEQRDREAANELRRAIYLAPYEDEPHLLLGRIYHRGGRLTEAIDEFKVAIWCRETAAARLALAQALAASGEREAARVEVRRALVLAPASAEARALLAKLGG